jgi:hypothetical protein
MFLAWTRELPSLSDANDKHGLLVKEDSWK